MAIHPTATIDPKAELDPTVEVGPYCVIEGHVHVAAGCRLFHNVYLTGWTWIGENSVVHPGAIVGHEPQDTKYRGERTYCRIGRGAILREYVTVHRGSTPESETSIGEDCFLLVGSHVGHNCVVGNRVTLINDVLLGGFVEIGDGATLGGAVGVHQFVRIGELAMIPGMARVTKDVIPFALLGMDGHLAGLNRVGLRRAGIPREQVQEIREAYRTLFSSDLLLSQAIERLAGQVKSAPCERLLRFLQHESSRGFAGRSRAGRKSPEMTCESE